MKKKYLSQDYKKINLKRGMTFVEVLVAMVVFLLFMAGMFSVIRNGYVNRMTTIINEHFLSTSNMVGGYLAAYDLDEGGDPASNALDWGNLGLTDAKNSNNLTGFEDGGSLKIVDVEVDNAGNWVTTMQDYPDDSDPVTPAPLGVAASNEERTNRHYDIVAGGPMHYTIGGSDKTTNTIYNLNYDGGDVSVDFPYYMRIFRETNTSVNPNLVSYRIRISPTEEINDNLGDLIGMDPNSAADFVGRDNLIGTEVVYQAR